MVIRRAFASDSFHERVCARMILNEGPDVGAVRLEVIIIAHVGTLETPPVAGYGARGR